MTDSRKPSTDNPAISIVEAQAFALKDSQGRVRAKLGLEEGETPVLQFFDADGRCRMETSLTKDGAPGILLLDAEASANALISLDDSGSPWVRLKRGDTNLEIVFDECGISTIVFENTSVGGIALDINRSADTFGLTLLNEDDTMKADLWMDANEGTTLRIEDQGGERSIDISTSGIRVSDANGTFVWPPKSPPPPVAKGDAGEPDRCDAQ